MTREELDFIGSMNMCDEISNETYKKIVCHCREQEPVLDKIRAEIIELRSRQNVGVLECLDILDKYKAESED